MVVCARYQRMTHHVTISIWPNVTQTPKRSAMNTPSFATDHPSSAPVATALHQALAPLQPQHIELLNESMNHAGYFEGKESHFKLTLVSDDFAGKRLVARHQLVYQLVSEQLTSQGGSVHALAIHAYTPNEWQGQSPDSPLCASKNAG